MTDRAVERLTALIARQLAAAADQDWTAEQMAEHVARNMLCVWPATAPLIGAEEVAI